MTKGLGAIVGKNEKLYKVSGSSVKGCWGGKWEFGDTRNKFKYLIAPSLTCGIGHGLGGHAIEVSTKEALGRGFVTLWRLTSTISPSSSLV
jgi:hypothetical protein